MIDEQTKDFLNTLNCIENPLSKYKFELLSVEEKGFAYFIKYKRKETVVEFLFGPPEFQVEILIKTTKGSFAFRDLLKNSHIIAWVNNNRYTQSGNRNIKNEILWFVQLLNFSLPFIE